MKGQLKRNNGIISNKIRIHNDLYSHSFSRSSYNLQVVLCIINLVKSNYLFEHNPGSWADKDVAYLDVLPTASEHDPEVNT